MRLKFYFPFLKFFKCVLRGMFCNWKKFVREYMTQNANVSLRGLKIIFEEQARQWDFSRKKGVTTKKNKFTIE